MANENAEVDCVPFFDSEKKQIKFEFWYILIVFFIATTTIILIKLTPLPIDQNTKVLMYAALGALLGGWVYCAKWFYRVTAKGKMDQHPFKWQKHKFYWRILAPFLAGLVSFSIYLLATANLTPIVSIDPNSGRGAFGFCFVFGYFSDLTLSRLAVWAESTLLPKKDSSQGSGSG